MKRVAILGLGLIGGSLGMALRQAGFARVVGWSHRPSTCQAALELGAVDKLSSGPAEAVHGADLVVIATPIRALRETLAALAPGLELGTVVSDTCSAKRFALQAMREVLPAGSSFVGGHPMAGKESSGIDAADARLFQRRPYVLTPQPGREPPGVCVEMVTAIGAEPLVLDADDHDEYVAAISHLPFVVASALAGAVGSDARRSQLAAVASSGFRDASRLAAGSALMYEDICRVNRDNILAWIERFREELDLLRDRVADGRDLEPTFDRNGRLRNAIVDPQDR